jgi:hypothetical protein
MNPARNDTMRIATYSHVPAPGRRIVGVSVCECSPSKKDSSLSMWTRPKVSTVELIWYDMTTRMENRDDSFMALSIFVRIILLQL